MSLEVLLCSVRVHETGFRSLEPTGGSHLVPQPNQDSLSLDYV